MTFSGSVELALTGRENELEKLDQIFDSTSMGKGTTVLVSGEAGVGKTRLVAEFLKNANKKGAAILAGWCLSDAAVPFFPFIEALNSYFSYSEEADVQPLGNNLSFASSDASMIDKTVSTEKNVRLWLNTQKHGFKGGSSEKLSPQVWKDQIFADLAETLHEISIHMPVVLFIEDLHWADSASLSLLHYLGRVVKDSEKILILGTYRTEGLTTDSEGRMHPLLEEMRLMSREDLFREIKLGGLSRNDILRMGKNLLGGLLDDKLIVNLEKESHGNSLFIVESIRMLKERQQLYQDQGIWHLSVDAIGIPSKIKDIVLQRIAPLRFNQRRVLDAASVIGEKFKIELLAEVLGKDNLEILETLDTIMQTTSLLSVAEGDYKFDHARSREILYSEIPIPLKRGYHAKVAEKLENYGKGKLPLSDLAYHYTQAGNKEKSIEYSLAAAKDELASFSNQQAIEHFRYVLTNAVEGDDEAKLIALEGLGDAYCASSRYNEAIKAYDEMAQQEKGVTKLRAIRKATDAAFQKGDKPTLLLEYAKKAEALAQYGRLEMARVINNRSRAFGFSGRARGADLKLDLDDSQTALQVFQEENSLPDMGDALWRSGVVSSMIHELREKGIGELLLSIAIFREIGDIRKEIEATLYAATGFSMSGLFDEADFFCKKLIELGRNLDVFTNLAQAYTMLSQGEIRKGNIASAIELNNKALDFSSKSDAEWLEVTIRIRLAGEYARMGNLESALNQLDKISQCSDDAKNHLGNRPELEGANIVVLFAQGKISQLDDFFISVLQNKQKNGLALIPVLEIMVRTNYASYLSAVGKINEAEAETKRVSELIKAAGDRFAHSTLHSYFMMPRNLQVGQEAEMNIYFVNVGRTEVKLSSLENFNLAQLKISEQERKKLDFTGKTIAPFHVYSEKIKFVATATGAYQIKPQVTYQNDLDEIRIASPNPFTITVKAQQVDFEVLPNRISTGYTELDRLLLGGIPQTASMILVSPSVDEQELLAKKYLQSTAATDQPTFYLTSKIGIGQELAEKYPSNFYLFICNAKADSVSTNTPKIHRLKGIENLTEIEIALTKAIRNLPIAKTPRICIDMISDVLLQHHAIITRKWLNGLLPALKAKGFTTLAILNPLMHSQEETQALLGLFEGEIHLQEKETEKGTEKTLRVRRLYNHRYLEGEITLNREKLN